MVQHLCVFTLILVLSTIAEGHAEEPREGQIRLDRHGGKGRVEIFHANKWGTICSNLWDINDANVACRELGYPKALRAYVSVGDNDGTPKWFDNIRCEGIENHLSDCASNGWNVSNCREDHTDDAAVECQTHALQGDVRLRTSQNKDKTELHKHEGHVQIFNNGKWTNICDDDWGPTETTIVCRQLGLVAVTHFTALSVSTWNVICTGKEDRLQDCAHQTRSEACTQGVHVTCSTTNPDSLADSLYNPTRYCSTRFTTNNTMNLREIREHGICVGVIPAELICTPRSNSTNTTCNRRIGFICDGECGTHNVTVYCPCNSFQELSMFCYDGEMEYAIGEKRTHTDVDCMACTCIENEGWVCDRDENFCKSSGPPSVKPTCYRDCEAEPGSRICELDDFIVEWFVGGDSPFCDGCLYANVTETYINGMHLRSRCPNCIPLNGAPRAVAVVNRMLPGPAVQVCENDRIIVRVINRMTTDSSAGTTIHWHGMHMRGTPYMDGAFMVTQWPIPFGQAFIYNFTAFPHGTHWWHSHAGLQAGDGLSGPLIVRQPNSKDVNKEYYDYDLQDHVIMLQNWQNGLGVNEFVQEFYKANTYVKSSKTILINGRGGQSVSDTTHRVPRYTQFNVTGGRDGNCKDGDRYRFRVISAAVANKCALKISVDEHDLTIIATDGASTKPFTAKSVIIFNAERYDFVLRANKMPGNYWIRVKGLDRKEVDGCKGLEGLAILHYTSSVLMLPTTEDDSTSGTVVDMCQVPATSNAVNTNFIKQLSSNDPTSSWTEPDRTYYLEIRTNIFHRHRINNVTFRIPPRPFLIHSDNPAERIEQCNIETDALSGGTRGTEACGDGYCECSHVLNVKLGEVVELVIINVDSNTCHPFHLHGYNFRVVAEVKLNRTITVDYIKELNENGMIEKKPVSEAIQKDTIVAPKQGYTVVQFRADNPGWWFLHCHYEHHLALGQVMVLHVGTPDDLPPPPQTYPSCDYGLSRRISDGETYYWSEEMAGYLPERAPMFQTVKRTLDKSRKMLESTFNRRFSDYTVAINRIKTDPPSGYHYLLFKIYTGDGRYIHLQLKLLTNKESNFATLVACRGDLSAEYPLEPLDVSSSNNRCRPATTNSVYLSSKASSLKYFNTFIYLVIVQIWSVILIRGFA